MCAEKSDLYKINGNSMNTHTLAKFIKMFVADDK